MSTAATQTIRIPHRWRPEPVWEGEARDLREAVARAVAAGVNLTGANLRGADLRGAYLRGADLRGAGLTDANLTGADLRGADLRDAYLRDADLRGAYLTGANLTDADLRGADLRDADLRGADLRDAGLTDANLTDADLRGAYLTDANLRGAYLTGAVMGGLIVARLAAYCGLYAYVIHAVVSDTGEPWVRMGCLWHSVAEWDRIGIRNSNPREYPDDDSPKCRERVAAFEFARGRALAMAEEWRAEQAKATGGGE